MTDRTDERDWQRLRELFAAAGEMSAAEREAFLDRELANEPAMRAELNNLFAAEASATEFLTSSKTDPIQRTIGPYRLVKLLGEGGFGIVYLAEQDRPLRRRVALKLIKPGMDTRQVIARFDAERQALAFMDHPGIAQVHDAGETETGRPYFVMEYVQGIPITAFCDESALPVRDRLELFLEVCDAIQHAHQKGMIHRDIKPSNVLVTRRDGVAIPKVIDFGIAKATGAGLADRTIATHEGAILGTLGSMSPEQAGAIEAVVDTRSDIYSLGVLLYELLTGQPPFDPARLRQISWTEAIRSIREEVPPAPSARVASQPDGTDAPRHRGVQRGGLLRELKGDLDWITMRALEKEPGRRYASASEFAADIRRHLQGQPVLAGAPSTGYRLRKFVRRHRVGVLAGSLVLLALLVGGVATGIGFRRALRAERTARREAASAEQVSSFLVDLFRTASPDRSKGETVTARTLLEDGARRIRASLKDDPEIRARLLTTLGKTHLSLGLDEEGLALLREALAVSESAQPRDEMDVAAQLLTLADGYRTTQQPDSIGPLLERAMATAQAAGEPGSVWRADYFWQEARWRNMRGETPAADSLVAAAIALAESEPEPHRVKLIGMYATKAGIAHREFNLKAAVANYERALQLAEEADDQPMWVASLHGYLASVYSALNEPDKAVLHANEGVRLAKQLYAPDHPSIARAMEGLAAALLSKQDYEGAAKVREEIVATLRSNDAPKYALAQALNSLAIAYQASGKIDLAIARTEEACAAYREVYGTENARTAEAMGNLARLYADVGQTVRADSLFLAALGVFGRLDPKGFFTAYTRMRYANLCRDTRRLVRADSLYLAAEAALDSTQTGQRAYLGECFTDHACLLSLQGRHTEAQALIPVGVALDFEGAEEKSLELGRAYVQWALVSARAGRPEIAIEKVRLAAGCGVPAESVVAYPELASLRGRADYPFVNSP